MDQEARARRIAQIVAQRLAVHAGPGAPSVGSPGVSFAGATANFTIARRAGCVACNPGVCARCGHLFTGEVIEVIHALKGKRVLSDKAVHYLSHGMTRYATSYVVHGQPVVVELDLAEIEGYFDL